MKRVITFLTLALAMLTSAVYVGAAELHLLSVNDMHAAIERFPQFAVIVDSLRAAHPDLLLISAGDNRTGNHINDTHPEPSKPMVDLMNAVGFNYSTFGNHEFDGNVSGLRSVINHSYCHYLCGNVYAPDSLMLHYSPFEIIERGGVRVAILGLIQVDEKTGHPDAHPKNMGSLRFAPVIDVAQKYLWLRDRCDVFVLLTHNGFDDDLKLARAIPQADVIIGGHSHTKLDPCVIENGVMITQAERWLAYATHITITTDDAGKVIDRKAELIDVKHYPRSDEGIAALVRRLSDNPELMRVLTTVVADFTEKEELGCLMADALRAEANADIALQNNGGVRYDSKAKGDFTVNDVYRLDPFGNEAMVYNLTGEEVERLLAAICRADDYGPAYVSGIAYSIHLGKDNKDVKNIKITMPDGSKFNKQKTYRVAMNSYISSVADYEHTDTGTNLFVSATDLLIKYLERQPAVDYSGVSRVTVVQEVKYSR